MNGGPVYGLTTLVLDEPDYYLIISYSENIIDKKKSIVFQMEPWVYDDSKEWGVKTWYNWANPNGFLHVRKHLDYLNPAQWMFKVPVINFLNRSNKIIAIISSKAIDSGHINRINFIKYVESIGLDIIDVYGYKNYHNFKGYKGTIDNKLKIQEYMYILSVENNREYNYATEKIWEAFVTCTYPFYDGCPNLSDYIDNRSYTPIDCGNKKAALSTILDSMKNNTWLSNLDSLIESREKTIHKYSIMAILNNIVVKSSS
jgi:hypothetical protein